MSGCSGLLLDLGILTRLRRTRQDPAVVQFLQRRRHQRIFISALTLCELAEAGMEDGTGPQGAWLRELAERFAANILPVDHGTALACEFARGAEPGGPAEPGRDADSGGPGSRTVRSAAVLAATARQHRLAVVSADAVHYAGLGVRILDPLAVPHPAGGT